ncbi:acyl-CoA dehydrogenase family protein, partial [Bacillus sp. WP8]|uniref:acyl-CoA dehydrogenase family protein n=1 Tax=Bacillus sp. WP8 TaxID=756828 RepID=UPI0021B3AF98
MPIPPSYQPLPPHFTTYIIPIHQLSKVTATIPLILSLHTSLLTMPIFTFATNQQKQSYLPLLPSPHNLAPFSLTQPNPGSDASTIQLTAH